jgi:dihydrodipicolinate synthase/N-acetylneuraminate lyase
MPFAAMKSLQASDITGTYATLLLPINADDGIDLARVKVQLDYLIHSGVDGIYAHGTAGEFYSLSEREFTELNELLALKCEASGMPFQIGACFPTPQLSLDRARRAAQLSPGAIQVILPDWYPLTLQESIAFLERVAEAIAPVPLVLYNPPHAKRVLEPEDYLVLCRQIPSIVGIKVGGGDERWYERMRPLAGRLSVFVPGHALATGYARGAAGSYSNVACLQPMGAQRWNRLMQTDLPAALAIEEQIQRFLKTYVVPFRDVKGHSNMALDKLLACVGNWAPLGTRLRWPYTGVAESEIERLRVVARESIPSLFEDVPV